MFFIFFDLFDLLDLFDLFEKQKTYIFLSYLSKITVRFALYVLST